MNEKFDRDIEVFVKQLEEGTTRAFHQVAGNLLSVLTLATPVGDPTKWKNPFAKPPGYAGGRARGNWQVTVNGQTDAETGRIDPSGQGTIQEGNSKIGQTALGDRITVQNNVPYIRVLNEGREDGTQHSFQAPIGFVETGVALVQEQFDPNTI